MLFHQLSYLFQLSEKILKQILEYTKTEAWKAPQKLLIYCWASKMQATQFYIADWRPLFSLASILFC